MRRLHQWRHITLFITQRANFQFSNYLGPLALSGQYILTRGFRNWFCKGPGNEYKAKRRSTRYK